MLTAMATKKKGSKTRASSAKKRPAAAAKKARAARKTAAPKRAGAPKRVAAKKAAAARKPSAAAKKATAAKKPIAAKSARAKVVAAPKRPAPAKPVAKAAPVHRRDGTGHLDPHYAATLRTKSLEGRVRDGDEAFIGRSGRSSDNLAEAMGETWVETATSGEDESEEVFNQSVPEDEGGPFVTTTAGQEFAEGTDASNPKRSKREAFPKT
jgi:hypothetical protein